MAHNSLNDLERSFKITRGHVVR